MGKTFPLVAPSSIPWTTEKGHGHDKWEKVMSSGVLWYWTMCFNGSANTWYR